MRAGAWLLLVLALPLPAQAQTAQIPALLSALHDAPDEDAARALESRLNQLWLQAGSPAAVLLATSGFHALTDPDAALADFDAALVLDPTYTQALLGRAEALDARGDHRGAIAALLEVLQREPRHFAAWQSLSRIAAARGDAKGALAAWRKLLEADPHTPDAAAQLNRLRPAAEGEAL